MKALFYPFILLLAILFAGATQITGCITNPDYGRVSLQGRDIRGDLIFSERERGIIHDYYRRRLPPGLARRERLPLGLRKHIARNGQLPPGLAAYRLPADLDRHLRRLPDGYLRARIGTDIVLFHEKTHMVLDIVQNIYP